MTYREIDPERSVEIEVVRAVADLEGVDPIDLPDIYSTVDHLLEHVSDPPDDDAKARIEFTYAGYRIAVNQDGRTSFRKVDR